MAQMGRKELSWKMKVREPIFQRVNRNEGVEHSPMHIRRKQFELAASDYSHAVLVARKSTSSRVNALCSEGCGRTRREWDRAVNESQ
jgi:hypothetical protein